MKNLRKVLSLVLAVAMACSMMVFASAANNYAGFPDKDQVSPNRIESVDVMAALGVFVGDENGNLGPQDNFTRAQAAKIVTYLKIGPSAAERLTPTGGYYTDVPASHWASKYIAYATEAGIVAGDGNGLYRPEDYVTGVEFAKMMNTVLGYGKMGEYTGKSWGINAVADAVARGLIAGDNNVDLNLPALREDVIQYTFNTIFPYGYAGELNSIYLGDNFIVDYNSIIGAYVPAGASGIYFDSVSKQSIGTKVFGLSYELEATKDKGEPARKWRIGNRYITDLHLMDEATVTSMSGVNITNLTDPKGVFAAFYYKGYPLATAAPSPYEVEYYINGKEADFYKAEESADKAGAIVNLYTDGIYVYWVSIIEKTVGYVAAPPTYSMGRMTGIPGVTITGATSYVGDLDLVKDDVILFYVDAAGVCHVEKAEIVEGQLTRIEASMFGNNATFGGTVRGLSELTNAGGAAIYKAADATPASGQMAEASNFFVDSVIYVDNGGNIVKFEPGKGAPKQYTYVLAFSNDGFVDDVITRARMILSNGTYVSASIAGVYNSAGTALAGYVTTNAPTGWYSYTVKDGVYTLRVIDTTATAVNTLIGDNSDGTPPTLEATFNSGLVLTPSQVMYPQTPSPTFYFTNSTVFVFYNDSTGTISVKTGINSLSTMTLTNANTKVISAIKGTGSADAYVFIQSSAAGTATARDVVFFGYITPSWNGTAYSVAGTNVYLNGVLQSSPLEFYDLPASGTTYEVTKDEDGIYTLIPESAGAWTSLKVGSAAGAMPLKYADGNLEVYDPANGTTLTKALRLSTDAKILVYDPNAYSFKDWTASPQLINTPSSINTTQFYNYYYVLDTATSGVNAGAIKELYLVPNDNAALQVVFGTFKSALAAAGLVDMIYYFNFVSSETDGTALKTELEDLLIASLSAQDFAFTLGEVGNYWGSMYVPLSVKHTPSGATTEINIFFNFPATP